MSYLFGQPSVLTNTESTNGTFYVLFEDSTTGVMAPRSDSGLTYNPSTNTLTSGVVVSTVSTGTAPFTVASTTLVTNLNADKLDGQDGSYYAVSTHDHSGVYQPVDADLTAIAALAGTSGILKKTAADTWALDTSTYLTGNQSISLSGDVSGSGTTAITVTITDDSHNHTGTTISALDAGDVTTGTFDIARIPTGSTGTTVSLGNHTHSYQPLDGDLTAIAALATNGFAKRTGTDTWTIDTTTYAPLNSPTLTGTPAAPTATQGTNTTQIATTAYVQTELSNFSGGQYLGTAATKAIMYNSQSIAENVTIGATQNALSAGPITIADGYTVTINDGGTWTIV